MLVPAYWKPGRPPSTKVKDDAVRAILARAFPGRKIVQIHSENFNYGGGGIHCATLQEPAVGVRRQP